MGLAMRYDVSPGVFHSFPPDKLLTVTEQVRLGRKDERDESAERNTSDTLVTLR